MKKFPKKFNTIVFSFVMALMMSCLMSFRNIGFTEDFLLRWLHAWWGAFLLGFVLNLFVVPTVRKVVDRVVEK